MTFNGIVPAALEGTAAAALAEPTSGSQLSDLAVGETGIIRRVRCVRRVAMRLMEMGLVPGTSVELVRVAPLGDPLELRLRGYTLSIRRAEASAIEIARRGDAANG